MTSSGRVRLGAIFEMLDKCASGYSVRELTHQWRVTFNGKPFFLQLGKRARKSVNRREIEIGHIRKMVRHLELDPDCVEKHLPQVKPLSRS
jgi:hypothetical protein